jgi:OOP family OmpA-OmpF porin
MTMRLFFTSMFAMCCISGPVMATQNKLVVSGVVPNESTKVEVLSRLRALYGADLVSDQLEVGNVVAPANWGQYVIKMIEPNLKQISKGEIRVDGNQIHVSGEVSNEAQRQSVTSNLANAFNQTYKLNNKLQLRSGQRQLDDTLADRTIEFQSGSAVLTLTGRTVLDEMARAIQQLDGVKIAIIGNTDNVGMRDSNIELSLARASAVRQYLIGKRIESGMMSVTGNGPDYPIADNNSADGRSKNRRIDFKILN